MTITINQNIVKCKACKSKMKCEITQTKISCIKCHRQFNSKICFDNHIKNKKCTEYSYMCIHCHRFYKTRDLKPDDHKCDQVKCGNCKQFVPIKDHQCYMLKKYIKPHMFFDFETKLDRQTNNNNNNNDRLTAFDPGQPG